MTPHDALISKEVGLFVDPRTDDGLFSRIALQMPVWIAGTSSNLGIAKVVRETLGTYVTTFDVSLPIIPLEIAIGVKEMLGLHHANMTCLHVFGLPAGGEDDPRWSDEGFELTYCKDGVATFECDEYFFE